MPRYILVYQTTRGYLRYLFLESNAEVEKYVDIYTDYILFELDPEAGMVRVEDNA
jgi:hypothetical protein